MILEFFYEKGKISLGVESSVKVNWKCTRRRYTVNMDGVDVDRVIKCMVRVIGETYCVYFKLKWNSLEFFTAGRNGLGTLATDGPEVYSGRHGFIWALLA